MEYKNVLVTVGVSFVVTSVMLFANNYLFCNYSKLTKKPLLKEQYFDPDLKQVPVVLDQVNESK